MSRRASLHRLRDISKQRSIRRLLSEETPIALESIQEAPVPRVEWPSPR